MRYVLGFDGGGTKTDCVLVDEARNILSRSSSGPSNPLRVGFEAALAALQDAAQSVEANAKVSRGEIAALCAGLAGIWRKDASERMYRLVSKVFPSAQVKLCTDLELALATTGDGPAIVLVAGTGSAAIGHRGRGPYDRVGGLGPFLGDEGSAYDVGRQALVSVMREFDRKGSYSELASRILRELDFDGLAEIPERVAMAPDEVFPRVFPVVASAADAGDETARKLLRTAADELAALVDALVERLALHSTSFLLAETGGMIGRSKYFDAQLDERLRAVAPQAEIGLLTVTPAEAAARLALQLISSAESAGN
jgi:N-acetylglucosamine kinase-like BadF-type ATPase